MSEKEISAAAAVGAQLEPRRTADRSGLRPWRQGWIFITKLLTAAALLQLVEVGAVRLDDPLSRWIAEYPALYAESVRIRHLLTQTSGIELDDLPDYLAEVRVARTADDLELTANGTW